MTSINSEIKFLANRRSLLDIRNVPSRQTETNLLNYRKFLPSSRELASRQTKLQFQANGMSHHDKRKITITIQKVTSTNKGHFQAHKRWFQDKLHHKLRLEECDFNSKFKLFPCKRNVSSIQTELRFPTKSFSRLTGIGLQPNLKSVSVAPKLRSGQTET